MLLISVFLLAFNIAIGQPQFVKGQPWPKLMQLYEGRLVDIQYDSTGTLRYTDWQGKRIPDFNAPYHAHKSKYLYVDSTGKELSGKTYGYATPFSDDLATVGEVENVYPDGPNNKAVILSYGTAVINTREEEVLPMDERIKYPIGKGLITAYWHTDRKPLYSLYNKVGKKLLECSDCAVGIGVGTDNFWVTSSGHYSTNSTTKLYNLNGKLLFQGPGKLKQQVHNHQRPQPYYEVDTDNQFNLSYVLDCYGKIVLDSVYMGHFSQGRCTVSRKGLAAVIDTNFQFIIPYSYGYEYIHTGSLHSAEAFAVQKNNRYYLINDRNEKLINFESNCMFSFSKAGAPHYQVCDKDRNYLYLTVNGDILIDGRYHEVVERQWHERSGFLVKCKSNGLKGYLDENGKEVIPCLYSSLIYNPNNLIVFFKPDGSCGYMDTTGTVKLHLRNIDFLTSLSNGYARCKVRVSDKEAFLPDHRIFSADNTAYQLHEKIIDSTGTFLLLETYPPHITETNRVFKDGSQKWGLFANGFALIYNQRTKKYGLINEKLQPILPVVYDAIDMRVLSFNYAWNSINGSHSNTGRSMNAPNVINGKIKTTRKGKERTIDLYKK